MSPPCRNKSRSKSGICRYVLDCRFNLNQWRRRGIEPASAIAQKVASTSVAGALISSRGRLAGGFLGTSLLAFSRLAEADRPGEPASDPGDPRGRQAGAQSSRLS